MNKSPQEIASIAFKEVIPVATFFKNSCYEYENETRLIFQPFNTKTEYRSNGTFIIPYCKIKINLEQSLIGVILGPSIDKTICLQTISEFLADMNLNNIYVQESKIPYRKYFEMN